MAIQTLTAASLALAQVVEAQTGLERWVEILTALATIVIALALIAIFAALIPIALSARKIQGRVSRLLARLEEQSEPILAHARSIADNADYVSTAVRGDVERLKQAIDGAQARLARATEAVEARISRFNSLLEVVQDEAEELFIDTASTVRGVRAGARALRESSPDLAWDVEDEHTADQPPGPRRHL